MNLDTLCLNCMDNDSGQPTCPKCGSPFGISRADASQLPPRTVLRGQYAIGRVLGQGKFGITYLAWDSMMENKVVVKEYMPNGLAERAPGQATVRAISPAAQEPYEFGIERFLEEARSTKKLGGNPNLISVETMFRDNGTAYLVTEFLEGSSLEEFLARRNQPIPLETAQRILTPALHALASVHEAGGVHGAVSPATVFLSTNGKVKLIGFGGARQALAKKIRNQALLKDGYAPEEQYRPSGVQCACTDVYGIAATFYRAITGKVPPSALDRLADDQLQTPAQLGVAMPPTTERALLKALSVRAAERCQSVEELQNGLLGSAAARVALPPPPTRHSTPQVPPPAPKAKAAGLFTPLSLMAARLRRPKRLALVGVLSAIALASATAALHNRMADSQPDNPQPTDQQQPAQPDAQNGDGRQQPSDDQQQQQQQDSNAPSQDSQASEPVQQDPAPAPAQAQPARVLRRVISVPAPLPAPAVDPVPVAAPPVIAPAPALVAPAPVVVQGYEQLLAQAGTLVQTGGYADAANLLTRAIATHPARWQAYNELAKLQLYYMDQPNEAFANYSAALAHGGHASFRVKHDHGGEFSVTCTGWLNISPGKASFVADDAAHTFPLSPVKDAKKNKLLGRVLGEGGHAFHVRLINNQNYNFAPTSSAPKAEANFIVSNIG